MHLEGVRDRLELTNGRLLGTAMDNASSHYSMTRELQSTPEASGLEWPALRNHMPCMAHVIQLALSSFMSSLSVKGPNKSWEGHERGQQFGENETIAIGNSQRLRSEGNARINNVSAMGSGLAKIIGKVCISSHFEHPETDLHIVGNACCIIYTDTLSLRWVYWLSKSQSPHRNTTYYGWEDTLELDTGVAWASLPITRILPLLALQSMIQWFPATRHNTQWMCHCQGRHGSFEGTPQLDPVVVEEAFSHLALHYHRVQSHGRSHGWHYVNFGSEEDSIEGILVLRCDISWTTGVKILCCSDTIEGYASYYSTYPRSHREVTIVQNVGHGSGYSSWGRDILYYQIPRGDPEVCGEWILCQTSTCTGQ